MESQKPRVRPYLARGFRPQDFSSVVGQSVVVELLKSATLKEALPQCMLFSGTRGCGKTTLARIVAKAFNCAHPTSVGDPCLSCSHCTAIGRGNHLDVFEMDGASNRGIDDVRKIIDHILVAPVSGKFRVFIIDEVHMLTMEAFNALLKTLEEPPAHVRFIFATTELHKVPATVLSRCVRFSLKRLTEREIVSKLETILQAIDISAEKAALKLIAEVAGGGLRDAESILDQLVNFTPSGEIISLKRTEEVLGIPAQSNLFAVDEALFSGKVLSILPLIEEWYLTGVSPAYFLERFADHFRIYALLKAGFSLKEDLFLREEDYEKYKKNLSLYPENLLLALMRMAISYKEKLPFYPHPRQLMELFVLELAEYVESVIPTNSHKQAEPPAFKKEPVKKEVVEVKQEKTPPKTVQKTEKTEPVNLSQRARLETLVQFAAGYLDGKASYL